MDNKTTLSDIISDAEQEFREAFEQESLGEEEASERISEIADGAVPVYNVARLHVFESDLTLGCESPEVDTEDIWQAMGVVIMYRVEEALSALLKTLLEERAEEETWICFECGEEFPGEPAARNEDGEPVCEVCYTAHIETAADEGQAGGGCCTLYGANGDGTIWKEDLPPEKAVEKETWTCVECGFVGEGIPEGENDEGDPLCGECANLPPLGEENLPPEGANEHGA